jgi:hypothetical protein
MKKYVNNAEVLIADNRSVIIPTNRVGVILRTNHKKENPIIKPRLIGIISNPGKDWKEKFGS